MLLIQSSCLHGQAGNKILTVGYIKIIPRDDEAIVMKIEKICTLFYTGT